MSDKRWLGQLMDKAEVAQMVEQILSLRGENIPERAESIARGWPLVDSGPFPGGCPWCGSYRAHRCHRSLRDE